VQRIFAASWVVNRVTGIGATLPRAAYSTVFMKEGSLHVMLAGPSRCITSVQPRGDHYQAASLTCALATRSYCCARMSTSLPLPSSPHCEPSTTATCDCSWPACALIDNAS
jgi:hypothetical protein